MISKQFFNKKKNDPNTSTSSDNSSCTGTNTHKYAHANAHAHAHIHKKAHMVKKLDYCNLNCCKIEKQLDCCTPQFLILDKLCQGWTTVSTTGDAIIPKDLEVSYQDNSSIGTGAPENLTENATAYVIFNSVYDRYGNNVLFPGNGSINFNYNTYKNNIDDNSLDVSTVWNVPNQVYGNLINFGQTNANLTLFGKYYSYFYYTTSTDASVQNCGGNGCTDVVNDITENLYQGWRGMTWTQFISSQIPYSSNSVNNNAVPDFGFGISNDGIYIPPQIIPTNGTVYSHIPTGSYDIVYDNALWAYLFVNTNRYADGENCNKLDQIFGWYVNIYTNQLILLQNLSDLGLSTTDDLLSLNSTSLENLSPLQLHKLNQLNKFYTISLKAIGMVKSNPKEGGNILVVDCKCDDKFLVAINTAKSNISWTNNEGEYVLVVSKLC